MPSRPWPPLASRGHSGSFGSWLAQAAADHNSQLVSLARHQRPHASPAALLATAGHKQPSTVAQPASSSGPSRPAPTRMPLHGPFGPVCQPSTMRRGSPLTHTLSHCHLRPTHQQDTVVFPAAPHRAKAATAVDSPSYAQNEVPSCLYKVLNHARCSPLGTLIKPCAPL